ncbi:hypothetical protein KR059_001500, partial [Drosophila kikkawai]
GKFYNTKYSPPKKVSKESKQLSNNIQKFLKKKEAEEAEKRREKNQKVAELMAKRDEKSKNKIRKMLKVTKSANKSVLDDAKDGTGATDHEIGEGQGDDYGYTSNEANALYEKYLEKVQHVQDNKSFAPSRPQSLRDLSGTKQRVKAAIDRERQEAESHTRQKRGTGTSSSSSSSSSTTTTASTKSHISRSSSSKTLYDPEAEKREEENKKRLAEQQNRAKLKRAAQPPPMDFQALLRLAEQKQHEPVVFAQPEKKKEPERLLSAKEKREAEERQRYREERAQRDKLRESGGENKPKAAASQGPSRMEPNGRIPKLSSPAKPPPPASSSNAKAKPIDTFKRPAVTAATQPVKASSSSLSSSQSSSHSSSSHRNPAASTKLSMSSNNNKTVATVATKPAEKSSSSSSGSSSKVAPPPQASRNPYALAHKNGTVRAFPPIDRPAGSGSLAKKQKLAPADVKNKTSKPPPSGYKRRICDDDESEYDSELDDFIDDGDCEEDISSHIRSIFGYDRRRYRDQDDDDRGMESSFAQMQREEFISKKLGLQEDLEDMRKEAMHKKLKMAKKRSKRL